MTSLMDASKGHINILIMHRNTLRVQDRLNTSHPLYKDRVDRVRAGAGLYIPSVRRAMEKECSMVSAALSRIRCIH